MNDKVKQIREGVEMNEMNIFKKKLILDEIVEEIRQGQFNMVYYFYINYV